MKISYDENNQWSKSTSFTTPTGWHIVTTYRHQKDSEVVKKSVDFNKLEELPEEIQQGLKNGSLKLERS
jgi:hypothetical protein|tara:strand:+ start:236 stop:442 length:207 start_codon:yes stop_codon:yes gene_type:complete